MHNKHPPRPSTPKWMRRTIFGRHREEFIIGGGIVLFIVILTTVTAVAVISSNSKIVEKVNITIEMITPTDSPVEQLPKSMELRTLRADRSAKVY